MPAGPRGIVRRWLSGNLHALAEVYLPYRLYRVTVNDGRLKGAYYYAIDSATGMLDPYQFTSPPTAKNFADIETRNCHSVLLDEKQTNDLAGAKVRRSLFAGGFFRLRNPLITANLIHEDFYIPYWAGFYGDERNLKIQVLNAVRQTLEGGKVSKVIQQWLSNDMTTQPWAAAVQS